MAIIIDKELPNGVKLEYFRIASLTTVVNVHSIIEVVGYTSQEKREEEQGADPETGCDVYTDAQYISVDYDPDFSVNKAYALLKAMPGWEGAEDVIDAWAVGSSYYTDDLATYDGKAYRCIQAHTAQAGWEPPSVPALWEAYEPSGEIPEWVQPTGAHDAYSKGDHVMHVGVEWVSTVDANTWEPGAVGTESLWLAVED